MNFIIYKSSAGSGKTFTLSNEYLKLALSSDSPSRYKNILAITFTNKAAQEMKSRVVNYLSLLSNPDSTQKGSDLIKNTLLAYLEISPETLKERANNTLNHILHNYSDFNITTIDKFIVRIVKSFNLEMKLPFQFEIEMDVNSITEEAFDRLIQKTGEDPELTKYILSYIKDSIGNDDNWNFESSVLKLFKQLDDTTSSLYFEESRNLSLSDYSEIRKSVYERLNSYEKYIKSETEDIAKKYKSLNLDTSLLFGGKGNSGVNQFLSKTILNSSFIYDFNVSSTCEKTLTENWYKNGDEVPDLANVIMKQLSDLVDYKKEHLPEITVLKEIKKSFFSYTLLSLLHNEVEILKQEKNIAYLSEFNTKINDFVVQQPIPFIYEKIGERFKNYLIDEFQDTSITQWQNLLPLVENALASNEKNIIVGDVKQAIYRWRGGDVKQFHHLPFHHQEEEKNEIIRTRYDSLIRHHNNDIKPLITNYRSLSNIVNFNNSIFEFILSKKNEALQSYYEDVEQKCSDESKKEGYAQIELIAKDDEDGEIYRIINYINDCKNRGISYKDIAILTRKNKENQLIAEALTLKNIPINSDESLTLTQSKEVNFIMNIYQILFNTNNITAIVGATDYLLNQITTLNYTAHQQILSRNESYENFIIFLNSQFKIELPQITSLSTYEIIEEIILLFKINTDDPFIQTLLNFTIRRTKDTPVDFITWWQDKKEKLFIATPKSFDAVNILTIHKSKGLEFDVVIIPFVNEIAEINSSQKNYIWIRSDHLLDKINHIIIEMSKAILEEVKLPEAEAEHTKMELDNLNLLYVAVTRASKELYLMAKAPSKNKSNDFQEYMTANNGTESFYSFGEKITLPIVPKEEPTTIPQNKILSSSWKNKVKISYTAPSIWNVPTNSGETFDQLDPRKFGNLIHLIFAEINRDFEYELVIENFFSKGFISEDQKSEITDIFHKASNNQKLMEFWKNSDHLVEKEIITSDLKSYRPDRILRSGNKLVLLDFKTGEQNKKDIKQVTLYQKLIGKIKNEPVTAMLYYTESDELLTIGV